MTPGVALWRLSCGVLLGGVLGILYGFLRPLGRHQRTLADVLFSGAAIWVWLFHSFAVCRGDIRLVYLPGICAGILLWEKTFGFWLRPFFFGFWRFLRALFRFLWIPWKKFLEFAKILFASAEKWVTIKCIKIFKSRQKRRKESHGKNEHPAQKCESGSSSRIQYP